MVAVSDEVGTRALLVHAIDDSARAFYTRFGFEPTAITSRSSSRTSRPPWTGRRSGLAAEA